MFQHPDLIGMIDLPKPLVGAADVFVCVSLGVCILGGIHGARFAPLPSGWGIFWYTGLGVLRTGLMPRFDWKHQRFDSGPFTGVNIIYSFS